MYIWQQPNWPHFFWDETALRPQLDTVRLLQGRLLGRTELAPKQADLDVEMDALIQNAIRTSEIEGEHLDVGSVRSSVARQLGLERAGMAERGTPESDSLVTLLLEATHEPDKPLTSQQLCHWQARLFPEGPGLLTKIRVGDWRGNQPMQVVSGRIDRPKVHFEAPPREGLEAQVNDFLAWFNAPPAAVFMGDTGSLALGGVLGAISIITKHELVLIIIGGLFVLEAVSVIVQVASFKLTGKRVFRMAPIHHHFEKKGWSESTVVVRFWIIAVVLAMIGLSTLKLR